MGKVHLILEVIEMEEETSVVKEEILREPGGRIFDATRKQVIDQEDTIQERVERMVSTCDCCQRLIKDPADIRPTCAIPGCHIQMCDKCWQRCEVCGRPVCPDHRFGFAEKGQAVCLECKRELHNRQAIEDQFRLRKRAFEEMIAVERERFKRLSSNSTSSSPHRQLPGRRTIERVKSKLINRR